MIVEEEDAFIHSFMRLLDDMAWKESTHKEVVQGDKIPLIEKL
jgi:hypothetical protein